MPHIHLGLAMGAAGFGFVLLFGTLWHVAAMWLAAQGNSSLSNLGAAMAFMY